MPKPFRYAERWPAYAAFWDRMKINPERVSEFEIYARFAIANKATYLSIEKATGVPWSMIAVIHRRENISFKTYLGNGQSLLKRTTIVPKRRGPFKTPAVSWEKAFFNGAVDALSIEGYAAVKDWRLEKELYHLEQYNGIGYFLHGIPSPYLWGGTNIQVRGKYVRDGVLDLRYWDKQPGCAPLLWTIGKLDPTVKFIRET